MTTLQELASGIQLSVMADQSRDVMRKARSRILRHQVIPLEQIKGEIRHMGYGIDSTMALDPDSHLLFFTDDRGQSLYAEFGRPDEGYKVQFVGHQSTIHKDYDVVDVKPGAHHTTETEHADEEDPVETPGAYPGSTPGVKPDEDDRGFGSRAKLEKDLEEYATLGREYQVDRNGQVRPLVEGDS